MSEQPDPRPDPQPGPTAMIDWDLAVRIGLAKFVVGGRSSGELDLVGTLPGERLNVVRFDLDLGSASGELVVRLSALERETLIGRDAFDSGALVVRNHGSS